MNYFVFLNISYPSYTYEPRHCLGGGIRSACVAIGMFSDNSDRCFRQLHLLLNKVKFSLWRIALQLSFHIDQYIYMYQSIPTNTWNGCKKIDINLAFTFVFTVCSLQIKKYRWLISKPTFDFLYENWIIF